jgi:UDP-N-acetylmuramyl pentapeptide phosphotransferase/UDP-N-acetylglucosamine-1-phosphate transferase
MSAVAFSFGAAFAIAVILTPLLRRFAHRIGYLDVPGANSSHAAPVPRSGGYAILLGIVVASGLAGALSDRGIAVFIAGAVALAIVAAIDEFRSLPRFSRFIVQIVIATAIAYEGDALLRTVLLPFGLDVPLGPFAGLVAIVWTVWMINAYNFMDGLNGMASVEGIVCGGTFAILSLSIDDPAGAVAAAAIAGASAGFVPFNLPSGSIFMGDVGSATLGLLFAVLSLRLAAMGLPFVAVVLPLLPFLFDSTVTVALRAARGERFFATRHRSHFYQRLNQMGYTHAQVTALYGLMALASSLVALAYTVLTEPLKVVLLSGVVAMHVGLALWVTARENR